jgi:hypothetical protein
MLISESKKYRQSTCSYLVCLSNLANDAEGSAAAAADDNDKYDAAQEQ